MHDVRSRALRSLGTLCRMYIYAVNVFMSSTFAFTGGRAKTKVSIMTYYGNNGFFFASLALEKAGTPATRINFYRRRCTLCSFMFFCFRKQLNGATLAAFLNVFFPVREFHTKL